MNLNKFLIDFDIIFSIIDMYLIETTLSVSRGGDSIAALRFKPYKHSCFF